MTVSAGELPHLWGRPPFEVLLKALRDLHLRPPAWNQKVLLQSQEPEDPDITPSLWQRREATSYLSAIISSKLTWLETDEQREEIWTEASRRLSERCGRTAMGEVVRTWKVQASDHSHVDLVIREPALVGDSLGLKTWGSSYLLAQELRSLRDKLPALLSAQPEKVSVLELGSGTGLLGLAAAAVWQTEVVLSDLPDIMSNLHFNAEANMSTIHSAGGSIRTAAFQWGGPPEAIDPLFSTKNQFPVVLAADPLYDEDHPRLLATAIHEQLSLDNQARALVMVPERDEATKSFLATFRAEMSQQPRPLICSDEARLLGQDDWGENDESSLVTCWWGIFRRGNAVNYSGSA